MENSIRQKCISESDFAECAVFREIFDDNMSTQASIDENYDKYFKKVKYRGIWPENKIPF